MEVLLEQKKEQTDLETSSTIINICNINYCFLLTRLSLHKEKQEKALVVEN